MLNRASLTSSIPLAVLILQVYSQLEESNLFLIQNSQETEEELEELKGKFRDARARLDAEVDGLQVIGS